MTGVRTEASRAGRVDRQKEETRTETTEIIAETAAMTETDFHQALMQGVDRRIRDSEHDSEYDSEYDRVKRRANESGSAERLNVPLRRLIVGTRFNV